jgi:hypothetical protein
LLPIPVAAKNAADAAAVTIEDFLGALTVTGVDFGTLAKNNPSAADVVGTGANVGTGAADVGIGAAISPDARSSVMTAAGVARRADAEGFFDKNDCSFD